MLRTINLRQIYCKICSQKIDLRIAAMNTLFCTSILSVCLYFLFPWPSARFHHELRQMIPIKICKNVTQSAHRRTESILNWFLNPFVHFCWAILVLSSNLFNDFTQTFILDNYDTYPTLFCFALKFMKISTNKMQIFLNNGSEATWKIGFETYANDFFFLRALFDFFMDFWGKNVWLLIDTVLIMNEHDLKVKLCIFWGLFLILKVWIVTFNLVWQIQSTSITTYTSSSHEKHLINKILLKIHQFRHRQAIVINNTQFLHFSFQKNKKLHSSAQKEI